MHIIQTIFIWHTCEAYDKKTNELIARSGGMDKYDVITYVYDTASALYGEDRLDDIKWIVDDVEVLYDDMIQKQMILDPDHNWMWR